MSSPYDVSDPQPLASSRYHDMEPYVARVDALLDEFDVQAVVPTHGLPIADRAKMMPEIREGIRSIHSAA